MSAQAHEIKTLGIADNIDQHMRRRHCELDNIFQVKTWMDSMSSVSKGKLDPAKVVDVVKYATILGTPLQPTKVEPWLRALLDSRSPTFQNKLEAVCTQGVTYKFMTDHKACAVQDVVGGLK